MTRTASATASILYVVSSLMASFLAAQPKMDFAIAIHGGAGSDPLRWTEETRQQRRDA